jgi:hypothetical protein
MLSETIWLVNACIGTRAVRGLCAAVGEIRLVPKSSSVKWTSTGTKDPTLEFCLIVSSTPPNNKDDLCLTGETIYGSWVTTSKCLFFVGCYADILALEKLFPTKDALSCDSIFRAVFLCRALMPDLGLKPLLTMIWFSFANVAYDEGKSRPTSLRDFELGPARNLFCFVRLKKLL